MKVRLFGTWFLRKVKTDFIETGDIIGENLSEFHIRLRHPTIRMANLERSSIPLATGYFPAMYSSICSTLGRPMSASWRILEIQDFPQKSVGRGLPPLP